MTSGKALVRSRRREKRQPKKQLTQQAYQIGTWASTRSKGPTWFAPWAQGS